MEPFGICLYIGLSLDLLQIVHLSFCYLTFALIVVPNIRPWRWLGVYMRLRTRALVSMVQKCRDFESQEEQSAAEKLSLSTRQ